MQTEILLGCRIPKATLGYIKDDQVKTVDAQDVFRDGKIVAIGVPGAYTPVCSKKHVPDFVRNVGKLRKSGFSKIICVAPNDPFVLDEWAKILDPDGTITFLSDGNLEFSRALGMSSKIPTLLLGERTERFLIITEKGVIQRIRVEPNILTFSCTRSDDALTEL